MVIAAALSALLFAAGCGGSDDDSATGSSGGSTDVTIETGSLSKAEFIKQASAACVKTQEQFEKHAAAFLEESNKNPPKPTETSPEITLVKTVFIPDYQDQVEAVSALGAPSGDEQELTTFLEALQKVLDDADANPQAFIESGGSFGKAPKLAKAYGLVGCAET